jgi:CBS domain-containing protein
MRVRELLDRKPSTLFTIDVDRTVKQAVHLLILHDIGGLPVVKGDGELVGIVAERDVVRAVERRSWNALDLRVGEIMRVAPTCTPEQELHEVMRRMTTERQRHLVVVDNGRIIGVISVGDLLKHRLEELETEALVLRDYLAVQRTTR